MSDRSDQNNLLHDVLAESSPPDFRAALLDKTLRQARRRRHWRQTRRAGAVLFMLFSVGWFAWQDRSVKNAAVQPQPAREISAGKNYQLIATRPLAAAALVATKNFTDVKIISSSATAGAIVTRSDGFRFINDQQLLALTGSRRAMLVRTGPNSEDLVFADAAPPTD